MPGGSFEPFGQHVTPPLYFLQTKRETHFETARGEESESTSWVGFDVKPEGSTTCENETMRKKTDKESRDRQLLKKKKKIIAY